MEENGVEEPLALAFNGGGILKRIMGDKWETSDVSTYVNSLLSHFQENASFDLFSIDSDVVTSFAAFCQKGDNIDRLSEYLVQCGFSNYKLAYGIYGATRGFASLPKTFTSSLINGEREYYKVTYLNIHEQLFGTIIVNAELPLPKQGNQTNVFTSEIGSKIISNISKIEPKPAKQTNVVNAVSLAVNLEDAVQVLVPLCTFMIVSKVLRIQKLIRIFLLLTLKTTMVCIPQKTSSRRFTKLLVRMV